MDRADNIHQISNTQHDLYLQEIEGIDDYWGPTFRAIYDNDEHSAFQDKLEQRIRHHDRDIERLCNVYYQGFIDSIRELLEVRSQAKKLNTEVVMLDNQLQSSAQNISKSGAELVQARKVQNNIAVVIAQLNLCLPVLTTYSKLKKQITEKRINTAKVKMEQIAFCLIISGTVGHNNQTKDDPVRNESSGNRILECLTVDM